MIVLLCASILLPAADKPKPSPEVLQARALAQTTPGFKVYVFHGNTFPDLDSLSPLPDAKNALAGTKVEAKFFDAQMKPCTSPTKSGLYGAVITVTPKQGPKLIRFVTLFRCANSPDSKAELTIENLPRVIGLGSLAVKWNEKLIKRTLRDRTFGDLAGDPWVARLFAGLSRTGNPKKPTSKLDDAFAVERQWWVTLKRKAIYPGEKFYLDSFTCPTRLEKAAPVVRTGTEEQAGVKKGTADKIDAVLKDFAKDTDQAFAVCIVRKGVIVLHKAYGNRDGKPMTVDTPSWMASVTKTMSATLMLMLIDQGKVSLDDKVDRFLPPLRNIKVKTPLTIHHLYTHTNGLTLDGWPGWSDDTHDVPERLAAYYDRLRVGKEWAYTGTGNIVGGKIFEMVTGTAIPLAFEKHLLKPLGCTGTEVSDTHAGAFSIPLDMAKFGQMLLNGGSYGHLRFFKKSTFEKALPGKLDKLLGPGAKRQFGFGLDGQPKRFGHGAASAATFHVDVERELVVIMTRNKFGKNQDKYNGKFWQAINDGIDKP